ncbi:MAG: ATP-binding protein [Candidatus Njordarchaeia archaeon]
MGKIDPRVSVIKTRIEKIKHIIAVVSGKGGVGKSVISSAASLILSDMGYKTGLLDLDFHGPSCHVILGCDECFPEEEKGLVPPKIDDVEFMSISFFSGDSPIPLRGSDVSNALKEILAITIWGDLDFLIVDMPPGMGDEILEISKLLERTKFVAVSTPSKLSVSVASRLLRFLLKEKQEVIGVIENMRRWENKNSVELLASNFGVPYLGSIHFHDNLEEFLGDPKKLIDSPFAREARNSVYKILNFLGEK